MRRKRTDYSYKQRTRDIVNSIFDTWQLTRKDVRDGIHRYLNILVSCADEFGKEVTYVENMFFPDTIDLTEEWVLYTTLVPKQAAELQYSGDVLSASLRPASSFDEMIAGEFDILSMQSCYSGLPDATDMIALTTDVTVLFAQKQILEIVTGSGAMISSGTVDVPDTGEMIIYADTYHTLHPIREPFRPGTVTLVTPSGEPVSCTIHDRATFTGSFSDAFDQDRNDIIWKPEKNILESVYTRSAGEFTPAQWDDISWLDVNKNGIIDKADYNAFMTAYPSVTSDITAVVETSFTFAGAAVLSYEKDTSHIIRILRRDNDYVRIYSDTRLAGYTVLAYDNGIYYTADPTGKHILAFTYNESVDMITGDVPIHVAVWSHECTIVDVDTGYGYLYVLVTDGREYRVYYGDLRQETCEYINATMTIDCLAFHPTMMSVTRESYVVLSDGITAAVYKPGRDRYFETDGRCYFNIKKEITDTDNVPCVMIPHYVFNHFDSFANTFGITRPAGKDNYALRELIYDFYRHPQDNSEVGMHYGILRELGILPDTVIPSGTPYMLQGTLAASGSVEINDCPMVEIIHSGSTRVLSGEIGSVTIYNNRTIVPDAGIKAAYSRLVFTAPFIDGNNDVIELSEALTIVSGVEDTPITVSNMGDAVRMEQLHFINDGIPTDEFSVYIDELETINPFIYKNFVVNTMCPDMRRISVTPVRPVRFEPAVPITSGQVEVLI